MGYFEQIYNNAPIFLQQVLLNAKASELYFERYGKKFWDVFQEFEKNQWLSESELEAYQNEKLKVLIRHVYEFVPYYRTIMDNLRLTPQDFNKISDLYKFPILTKSDIRRNSKQLISKKQRKIFIRQGHTSGTTGSPLDVYYDIKTCTVHHAADWRQKYWAGLRYGDPYASIQGRVIVPLRQKTPPFWRKNYINNQLFLSSFHLKEGNLPHYFSKLERDKIKFVEGYPSTIYILAMYLNKYQQTFPLKAILTSSEPLFDYQREAISKAFCCKIFNFLGMAERVVFATECDQHKGHHLNSDYGITEFLDSNNEPVEQGKTGRVVATSLYNFAMPLIRYQTNDSCSLKNETCKCGRKFPLMRDVVTKDESIITLPDGRLISPSVLTHPFKPMHNIIESQIIQEKTDELIVKIVRKDSYSAKDEDKLLAAFEERLGREMRIKIKYVDSIPRTKSGKFKWVISKITPYF